MKKCVCLILLGVLLFIIYPASANQTVYSSNGYKYIVLEDGTISLTKVPFVEATKTYTIPSVIDDFKVSEVYVSALYTLFCERLVFPDGVETLWDDSLFGSPAVTKELVFPASMRIIGWEDSFSLSWADHIEKVTIDSNNPVLGVKDGFVYNKQSNTLLYYPASAKKKSIVTPKGIESIQTNCFSDLKNVESIEVSEGVLEIAPGAFLNCEKLKTIKLPSTLTWDTFEYDFHGCINVAKINVSKGNTHLVLADDALINVGTKALLYMPPQSKIASYEVPEDIKVIKDSAFSNCKNLDSVHIPGAVKIIEQNAFYGCSKLKSVIIDEGVQFISKFAFTNCPHIPDIIYPQSAEIFTDYPFDQ